MIDQGRWADLAPRVASGAGLLLLCGVEIYIGGTPFSILVWIVCGLMVWELSRMFGARWPVAVGVLSGLVLMLAEKLPQWTDSQAFTLPLILATVLAGTGQVTRDRALFGLFMIWIMAGSYAFLVLRNVAGLEWFVWLVAVVVISDVLGYFAGRVLGGPKFWPRVSPKKTWSGTLAGWIGAALIGVVFALVYVPEQGLVTVMVLSVVAAFAGQMGDIAESAVKRRVGVKDSSSLIPGHGGLLDRFDAMLGASVFMFVFWAMTETPGAS